MTWQFTDDVHAYARRTWPLLAADPAGNTIALTVIENLRAGRRRSAGPMTFGWFTSGKLAVRAVSMTPPYELLLAEVPTPTIAPLADALAARGVVVTGVNGETGAAEAFAIAWTARRPAPGSVSTPTGATALQAGHTAAYQASRGPVSASRPE